MAQQQLNDGEEGLSFRSKLNDMFRQLFGFTQSIQQLADGTTINTDCTQFAKAKVILQGNRTLANPTNMQIGVEYTWYIVQDNVGSRLITDYGSYFSWLQGGAPPLLSTAPNAVDRIKGEWDGIKLYSTFDSAIPGVGGGFSGVTSVNSRSGVVTLSKTDVGLSNVDNTADTGKPVSTAQQTALNAKSNITRTQNAQTGTTYTLVLSDAGNLVTLNNAAAITLTVPTNASVAFSVGTQIDLGQLGAGQVTVAGAAGVTINSPNGLKIAAQYGGACLIKIGTNTWWLEGRLSP